MLLKSAYLSRTKVLLSLRITCALWAQMVTNYKHMKHLPQFKHFETVTPGHFTGSMHQSCCHRWAKPPAARLPTHHCPANQLHCHCFAKAASRSTGTGDGPNKKNLCRGSTGVLLSFLALCWFCDCFGMRPTNACKCFGSKNGWELTKHKKLMTLLWRVCNLEVTYLVITCHLWHPSCHLWS